MLRIREGEEIRVLDGRGREGRFRVAPYKKNAKAVALFGYLERARPELASDEAEICPLFGYTVAAFREAEDEELAQAGATGYEKGGCDEMD